MRRKRITAFVCLMSVICLTSGCAGGSTFYSSYRDVTRMQVIETVGVDLAANGGIKVTVAARSKGGDTPAALMTHEGATVRAAMDAIQQYAAKEHMFSAHAGSFVIGDALARVGFAGVLDYIARDPGTPLGTSLFVVKSAGEDSLPSAESLLNTPLAGKAEVSDTLDSAKLFAKQKGVSGVFTCAETTAALHEFGCALICAVETAPAENVVRGKGEKAPAESDTSALPEDEGGGGGENGAEDGQSGGGGADPCAYLCVGYGVISDGVLTGYIEGDAARGVTLLLDKAKGATVSITGTPGQEGALGLNIRAGKPKITAGRDGDGALLLKAALTVSAALTEAHREAFPASKDWRARVENAVKREVESWLTEALEQSLATGEDFLGLALVSKSWREAKGIGAEVTCKLTSSGDLR